MVGELVTLPVRVGIRVTRRWFRAIEESVSLTASATGRMIDLLASRSPNGASVESPPREPAGAEPEPSRERSVAEREPSRPSELRPAQPVRPPLPTEPPAPTAPAIEAAEPVHVSEEPVLVEEFAEPGAEEGAGAEVHVNPPWDGYEGMSAKQVITRLATADPAEIAAVQLYEGSNRRRRTVMNAVERQLRSSSR